MAAKKKKPEEKSETPTDSTRSMRDAAEKKRAGSRGISSDLAGQTAEELIHELQVHQTEIEMQAEELRRTSLTLEESRDKYRDQYLDLYEFAPIGYLTLTDKAQVTGANLTVATLLGVDRNTLINHWFRKFIAPGDLDLWDRYFVSARQHGEKQTCTLTLRRGDGSMFPARLDSIQISDSSDGTTTIRVAISDITEICRSEEEIKFKNVILSTQQETSLDGILAVDENGKILSFNRHFIELWGIPDDVIASRSDERALQSVFDTLADPDTFVARVTYLYDHKDEKSREEILLKDGRVLDRYSAPMLGPDRKYYGRVWYFRDITERKRAEEALRESEARFRNIFSHAAEGILIADISTQKFLHANPAICSMLGYSAEELTSMNLRDIHPEKDFVHVQEEFMAQARGEKTLAESIPLLRNDGAVRYMDIRTTPVIIDGHRCNLGMFTDITDRKQAEKNLHVNEERLIMAQEISHTGSWEYNLQTGKIWGSAEGARIYGFPAVAGDFPIDTIEACIPERERVHQALVDLIQAGKEYNLEFTINPADGSDQKVIISFAKLEKDALGNAIRVVGVIQDITKRKKAEDTISLANRKLSLMNDVTYQFIQNKVTALRGYTELSKDAKTEAERLSFIEKEEHILADIQHLIKNTQDYQEIGLLQPRWIPVEQSIRIAISLVSPKQDISIETALHGLELYSDPLIEKIFANLIDNTVKHGKTTTYIRFSCEETPDGLILICEDDGVGISPGVKARLFDRSVGKTIHFGLFFVRECLLLSGMMIAETGTPGKGARFEITVPKGTYRLREGI